MAGAEWIPQAVVGDEVQEIKNVYVGGGSCVFKSKEHLCSK